MAIRITSDIHIPATALLRVLGGVQVAVKGSDAYVKQVSECVQCYDGNQRADSPQNVPSTEPSAVSTPTCTVEEWRSYLEASLSDSQAELWSIIDVALAVGYLREKARNNEMVTPTDTDEIWTMIYRAIMTSSDSEVSFSAVRSAQGFIAVALCSLIDGGNIQELWRFHVWLPDNERGVSEVVIHAHQPFAQSWILAGCGTDHVYDSRSLETAKDATHALYDCCYMGSGNAAASSSGYQTHQLSSTVTNTGKFVRVSPVSTETHTRDTTYTVPGGMYHKSVVSGSRFHATLFVFDASRGFDKTAGVLGPLDGGSYTQLRDPKGLTAQVLAQITNATRSWEQAHSVKSEAQDEHMTVLGYYNYFRGMGLLKVGKTEEAMQYQSPGNGHGSTLAFAKEPSPQHRQYLADLIEADLDIDVADEHGCTALDYAIYNDDDESSAMIMKALRDRIGERRADRRLYEANIRKSFRDVFEDQLRPILLRKQPDGLQLIRHQYAGILENDEALRSSFDGLRYLTYADLVSSARLPRYTDEGVLRTFHHDDETPRHFIYIAYRWIHKDPVTGKTANDDKDHTQFCRMKCAIDQYLDSHPNVDRSQLGIWLDSVCIDRKNPLPGIAALPINLAQCDALITVEDEEFWTRAWCSVEAFMMQKLRKSYPYYNWVQYAVEADGQWSLREAPIDKEVSMANLTMTWEEDRDKILFLERQGNLL